MTTWACSRRGIRPPLSSLGVLCPHPYELLDHSTIELFLGKVHPCPSAGGRRSRSWKREAGAQGEVILAGLCFEGYSLLHAHRLEFAVSERPPQPLHRAEPIALHPPNAQEYLEDEDRSG